MKMRYKNGRGTLAKALLHLLYRAPKFHARQMFRNMINPNFWKYAMRNNPAVRKKTLFFWQWWSLNRDMPEDESCPGWQWWYYEMEGVNQYGKKVILKNYRKFPLIRSAIDGKIYDRGECISFTPTVL